MRRFGYILLALLTTYALNAQQKSEIQYEIFRQYVINHHPVVKQATLLSDQAASYLQKARGAFDPKLYTDFEQKTFAGKRYYSIGDAGVKWPLGLGITIKSNYLWSNGVYLNPENALPLAGQWNLGLELQAIQGLLIDERRTSLRQAQVMRESSENEQLIVLNNLLLEAGYQYWQWVYTYRAYEAYEETLAKSISRFNWIRERYLQGDLPALDTLEAWIQVQTRRNEVLQAGQDLQSNQLKLAVFLWQDDKIDLELARVLVPVDPDPELPGDMLLEDDALLQEWVVSHPEMKAYDYKTQMLDLDRKWTKEQLKPSLAVSYQLLGDGFQLAPPLPDSDLWLNNSKWGVRFGFPLFLRKERANLALTDQKIRSVEWDSKLKEGALISKINTYRQQALAAYEQWEQQESLIDNQELLLEGETEKLRLGSSSVLVINLREQKVIESRLKMLKWRTDLEKALVGWQAATFNGGL